MIVWSALKFILALSSYFQSVYSCGYLLHVDRYWSAGFPGAADVVSMFDGCAHCVPQEVVIACSPRASFTSDLLVSKASSSLIPAS